MFIGLYILIMSLYSSSLKGCGITIKSSSRIAPGTCSIHSNMAFKISTIFSTEKMIPFSFNLLSIDLTAENISAQLPKPISSFQ